MYIIDMKLILTRHGETDWNVDGRLIGQTDIPLNDNGRKQAQILKDKLSDINFDCCYSSPLKRAKETAEIICNSKCPIFYDNNLKERYGGEMEGKPIGNLGDYENCPSAETDAELPQRAKSFLTSIKNTNYQSVLIVSHSGLLKNLRHCILELTGDVDYGNWHLQNSDFEIYNI